jgi:multifunctional methyltransferase subunit TRM112
MAQLNAQFQIGQAEGLVELDAYNTESLNDEEFLKRLHIVLLEVEIIEGELICPETGRKFPISNGIPNMLVNDDEV